MAAADSQQTWVPYVPTRDCSMGFCSVYCPQWCYIIFPPPPPVEFSNDDSGVTFSPLVIAIIGILSSAFLLICYYTIVSKYCGNLRSLPRWHHSPAGNGHQELVGSQSRRRESWHESPSNGVDEALICKIAVHKYRRGDGVVSGSDCSVCLNEFREDDRLRLLPKCSHAFHLPCIDTWLRSHSSCPLCRASIVPVNPAPPSTVAAAPEPASASQIEEEMVVVVEDRVASVEEESGHGSSGDAAKGSSQIYCDSGGVEASHHRHSVVEIRDDDVIDDDDAVDIVLDNGRTSIADVLRINMEEQASEKENGFWVGNTSHRAAGDHSKRSSRSRGLNLHGVLSPVPMKRSASNGRFCLSKHGNGRNVLPVEASE